MRTTTLSLAAKALGLASAFLCAVIAEARVSVTPYPRVPDDDVNADYVAVAVSGVAVETVATNMRVGYAHFAFAGRVRVEITAREAIRVFDLSPHRLGIDATVAGNVLSLELDEPCKLHLRINQLSRFFIFADPPETDAVHAGQTGVITLTDRGVRSDPEVPQSAAIQAAIDDAAALGFVLHVPPGIYRTGRLHLRSGLRLHIAPGAILKGTGQLSDFPRADIGGNQMLLLEDAEDVRIFGRGVIDGNGQALRRAGNNSMASRAKLLSAVRSRRMDMRDVILRDAGVWCVHLIESEDMDFDNLKIISLTRAKHDGTPETFLGSNTDGFDPDNSSRIRIEDCFLSCDDDAIAVKLRNGARRDISGIVFRGNVIWTMCSALKIGTEIHDRTVSDVLFADNDIINADVGIAVWCWRGGTVADARWINNHFEAIGVVPKDSPHKKETNIRITIRNVEDSGRGHIRNLLIKDNTFERFSPNDSMMQGLDPEHIIDGVTFENLVIAGRKRLSDEKARMTVSRFTRNVVFE